ncbi:MULTISPECIES: hypothetical protein [Ensifer]|uniref:Argininosuccinate lyase n=1 Tax=Ensifer adhaerens TaxID=106592 RepID=A0A0L8C755_ENSAD|nr:MULTISPECIES: hypothetical protein [Ensifer]KOF22619.1 hypothetical protein AC244_03675 [Ensifer adhaerens]OCP16959.1 hypothetical protein BC360_11980 [Ensifer sp. LC163]OCP24212.1 hypothetical protein BC363_23600 [Ensifer sp. LC384]OCP25556.1 hypothetical protein BC361_17100 [Ensifer sp. LC54]
MKCKIALTALAVLAASTATASAEDLVFQLKNKTEAVLTNFYTSPVGVDQWEDDVFGRQVLNPGESMEITIADGRDVCKYDMRFEFEEGSGLDTTEDTQDLCELGEYSIHQ